MTESNFTYMLEPTGVKTGEVANMVFLATISSYRVEEISVYILLSSDTMGMLGLAIWFIAFCAYLEIL